ncbi:serine/threonine-protein kinase [Polyangium aurulentum]|uniref:serine/threonine-protein kinase n=1 Tax=Polyangium aurulentum TaxID=2567896 RepID=UPI00146E50D9|nr:serine/threonine-protein kinase [Polyangium aurulentum]UQA62274.1 serine/threonine protein kinase [Polyangium aurulentum]
MNPGDLIQSRYRLVRLLGSGASGAVWAARNELIDRDVALKILHPDVAADAVALQRFFNEAKASGRVRSPSIVEILDLGQAEDGSPFLVFELLQGQGLDAWLARERTIDPETLMEMFVGVVRALDSAHAQGIIHRDLKPANLYAHRAQTGSVVLKILDFGISKVLDAAHDLTLTRTGTVVGSPAYMSPEQAAGREDIDGRADVWSLGVVMHEALTGTLPHEAANYNALMVRILTRDADPILTRRPDLPPSLASIVDDCLRRDRERRPTAGVLAARLESSLLELQTIRYGAPPPSARRLQSVPSMPRIQTNPVGVPNPAELAMAQQNKLAASSSSGRGVLILAAGIGVLLGMLALFVLSRFLLR